MTDRRHANRLTDAQYAAVLAAAKANPSRAWSEIADALHLPRWRVYRVLRAQFGKRVGTDEWRQAQSRSQQRPANPMPAKPRCPSCAAPIPRMEPGRRFRCPCGRLIEVAA